MSSKKIFFDHFISKNALIIPKKGQNPILADLYSNARRINLKRVERITCSFDPFYPNIASFREMIHFLNGPKVRKTNEECLIRTSVVNSGTEPEIKFFLKNGKKLIYKTGLLQTIDILNHLNNQIVKLESEAAESES